MRAHSTCEVLKLTSCVTNLNGSIEIHGGIWWGHVKEPEDESI